MAPCFAVAQFAVDWGWGNDIEVKPTELFADFDRPEAGRRELPAQQRGAHFVDAGGGLVVGLEHGEKKGIELLCQPFGPVGYKSLSGCSAIGAGAPVSAAPERAADSW